MHIHPLRSLAAVMAAGLVVAACGGDDDTTSTTADGAAGADDATASPATADEELADEEPADSADTPDDTGGTGEAGVGFVEIGGTRFDVTVSDCIEMAGAIGGRFVGVDDAANVSGNFTFSPNDWESRDAGEGWTDAGSLTLRSDDPYLQWETGQELVEGYNLPAGVTADQLAVTEYRIDEDAPSVRGTAGFLDVNALMTGTATEPVTGTFELTCPAD